MFNNRRVVDLFVEEGAARAAEKTLQSQHVRWWPRPCPAHRFWVLKYVNPLLSLALRRCVRAWSPTSLRSETLRPLLAALSKCSLRSETLRPCLVSYKPSQGDVASIVGLLSRHKCQVQFKPRLCAPRPKPCPPSFQGP